LWKQKWLWEKSHQKDQGSRKALKKEKLHLPQASETRKLGAAPTERKGGSLVGSASKKREKGRENRGFAMGFKKNVAEKGQRTSNIFRS